MQVDWAGSSGRVEAASRCLRVVIVAALLGIMACDGGADPSAGGGGDADVAGDIGTDAPRDDTASTDDTTSSADVGVATFSVSAAIEATYEWSVEAGNLVFCRLVEGEHGYVWVRFAAVDGGDDGESAPHVDIDICAFAGTATFPAQLPSAAGACRSPGFDIWWHDGPEVAYANGIDAAECVLDVVASEGVLGASFACDTLLDQLGAEASIAIAGSFGCVLETP